MSTSTEDINYEISLKDAHKTWTQDPNGVETQKKIKDLLSLRSLSDTLEKAMIFTDSRFVGYLATMAPSITVRNAEELEPYYIGLLPPLVYASGFGQKMEMLTALLESPFYIQILNIPDDYGTTPLEFACEHNQEMANALLHYNPHISEKALHLADQHEDKTLLNQLRQHQLAGNPQPHPATTAPQAAATPLPQATKMSSTPKTLAELFKDALIHGRIEDAQEIFKVCKTHRSYLPDDQFYLILETAHQVWAENGKARAGDEYQALNEKFDIQDSWKTISQFDGNDETQVSLQDLFNQIRASLSWSAVMEPAMTRGNQFLVSSILSAEDIYDNKLTETEHLRKYYINGQHPLIYAAQHNTEMIPLFRDVMYIKSLNIADDHGMTPLMWACKNKNVEAVKLLAKPETDLYFSNAEEGNRTVVDYAAESENTEILDQVLLYTSGASQVANCILMSKPENLQFVVDRVIELAEQQAQSAANNLRLATGKHLKDRKASAKSDLASANMLVEILHQTLTNALSAHQLSEDSLRKIEELAAFLTNSESRVEEIEDQAYQSQLNSRELEPAAREEAYAEYKAEKGQKSKRTETQSMAESLQRYKTRTEDNTSSYQTWMTEGIRDANYQLIGRCLRQRGEHMPQYTAAQLLQIKALSGYGRTLAALMEAYEEEIVKRSRQGLTGATAEAAVTDTAPAIATAPSGDRVVPPQEQVGASTPPAAAPPQGTTGAAEPQKARELNSVAIRGTIDGQYFTQVVYYGDTTTVGYIKQVIAKQLNKFPNDIFLAVGGMKLDDNAQIDQLGLYKEHNGFTVHSVMPAAQSTASATGQPAAAPAGASRTTADDKGKGEAGTTAAPPSSSSTTGAKAPSSAELRRANEKSVSIKTVDGFTHSIPYHDRTTILEAKQILAERLKKSPEEIVLIVGGLRLRDTDLVHEQDETHGHGFQVVFKDPAATQIVYIVREGGLPPLTILYNDKTTVRGAKEQIAEQDRELRVESQRLLLNDRELGDDEPLRDLNLQRETLRLVTRQYNPFLSNMSLFADDKFPRPAPGKESPKPRAKEFKARLLHAVLEKLEADPGNAGKSTYDLLINTKVNLDAAEMLSLGTPPPHLYKIGSKARSKDGSREFTLSDVISLQQNPLIQSKFTKSAKKVIELVKAKKADPLTPREKTLFFLDQTINRLEQQTKPEKWGKTNDKIGILKDARIKIDAMDNNLTTKADINSAKIKVGLEEKTLPQILERRRKIGLRKARGAAEYEALQSETPKASK